MRKQAGFSLVEILVVLVVLGLTATFATIGFQRLENDRLEKQAGQLSAWMQSVSDNAILDGAVYGIRLASNQQDLELAYFLDNRWWQVTDKDMSPPNVDEDTELLINVGEKWSPLPEYTDEYASPGILFLPTGMALPEQFRLVEQTGEQTGAYASAQPGKGNPMAVIERDTDGRFTWSIQ